MGGSRMARSRQTDQVRPQARSATTSFAPDPSGLQALQRTAGNAAVTSLLGRGVPPVGIAGIQRGRKKRDVEPKATPGGSSAPVYNDPRTWTLNPVAFLNGVPENMVDESNLKDLRDKVITGNSKIRSGSRQPAQLDKRMHCHNAGHGGISFAYRKEDDNTVTPVVYDLATKRTNGNDYAWGYGGGKNAGTSSASAGKAMALG